MILFTSNADTDLLALRSVVDDLPADVGGVRWFHPDRIDGIPSLDGVDIVVVRLLGGRTMWTESFAELQSACRERAIPLVAAGGEDRPDAAMVAASSVPAGVAHEAHRYLSAGGPANLGNLVRFLADTLRMTGLGFDPPAAVPAVGIWTGAGIGARGATRDPGRPLVAVIFYRAHLVAGNTTSVADLCAAVEVAGADALAIWTYSLRGDAEGDVHALDLCREHGVDVIVTSTLAAGSADDEGEGWSVPGTDGLAIPVIQAPATGRSRAAWAADDAGLSPFDVATGVAIPEFDGRIIGPTYAFKEVVDDGDQEGGDIVATRADPERTARLARLAVRTAALGHIPTPERRVAIVLSAYPTNRARLGNAVGLDTPASAIRLLEAMDAAGYEVTRVPRHGDDLMDELAAGFTYDDAALSPAQLRAAAGALPVGTYEDWFDSLPVDAADAVGQVWGPAPGSVYVADDHLHFPGIDLGNVLVTIQPPRGFGADPIGTYHSPDLPPPHHYLAFYRWLGAPRAEGGWGADAVVHLGKHGTLEWLPGKALAPSAGCFPDAAIGDLPFFYPFVVNDPGEGAQAKRRAHAVVIDHLPPPMVRAEAYDDLVKIEQVFDAYAQVQAMDPDKLPAMRAQVWELLVQAQIHRDLDLGDALPDDGAFDDVLLHVDGYLCALKDAQIRGGLHVLGQAPGEDQLVDTVLSITRLRQGTVPSLRETVAEELSVDPEDGSRAVTDLIEATCRERVEVLAEAGWVAAPDACPTLRWVADRLVPDLRRTPDELHNLLAGLAGRQVPSGPSGAPSRGGAHVLPTGRNFYSVDPKAIPSPLAWQVGQGLADRLVERHVDEAGTVPRTVGLVLWGTATMRTSGDDVAEALALLGVRPVWHPESQRVTGLEVIPLAELGRPRVDVTLRISGFFRGDFPHVVDLLDDAVHLVGALAEPVADNPVHAVGTDESRLWGPPPGGYGSGVLSVLDQRAWRTDEDLAEVYLSWSGFAYGRRLRGAEDAAGMRRRFAAIEVAVKNQDNREHDIFDSSEYLEDHGGMVAAVRSLRGEAPKAWFGDSSDPAHPKVRSLKEEAARVVRSRVLNPRWIDAMCRHGYKGAFELAATVDYLVGYDATAQIVEDWMYERVTEAYVGDPALRKFFATSNPAALRSIAEKLLEAAARDLWDASPEARQTLVDAVLEAESWEEGAVTATPFPFHLVVDQDDAKLALVLVAIDPRIGGVLLRGHKGSAKTTLARGLGALLDGPFVELPLGTTEDRLVGTLDAEAALTGGGFRFREGLLAEADGGVLYVDEINLLPDHLVDLLLDVTASGENVVERDGISHRHPARFVLVGSMNPEEGELRPQLLDRFGFCVEVAAPTSVEARVAAVRRRLAFDGCPPADGSGVEPAGEIDEPAGVEAEARIRAAIVTAEPAALTDELLRAASRLAIEVGAEGLRADLALCRAAAAAAGLDGRPEATPADLRRIAGLVLSHRSRRGPFDPPMIDADQLASALDDVLGDEGAEPDRDAEPNGGTRPDRGTGSDRDTDVEPDLDDGQGRDPDVDLDHDPRLGSDRGRDECAGEGGVERPDQRSAGGGGDPGRTAAPERPLVVGAVRRAPSIATDAAASTRGRHVRDAPMAAGHAVSVRATVRSVAGRRAAGIEGAVGADDLRREVRAEPLRQTIVLCVDLSGSMGARERAEAATGTALGLLSDAYLRRDRVALVGFRGDGAEVLLAPTTSVEVARNRLVDLPTGGQTPLAEGIGRGLALATAVPAGERAVLVVLTDGRATGSPDALAASMAMGAEVRGRGVDSMVLDCETGAVRLGLAAELATAMGARHVHVDDLDPGALAATIRSGVGR